MEFSRSTQAVSCSHLPLSRRALHYVARFSHVEPFVGNAQVNCLPRRAPLQITLAFHSHHQKSKPDAKGRMPAPRSGDASSAGVSSFRR